MGRLHYSDLFNMKLFSIGPWALFCQYFNLLQLVHASASKRPFELIVLRDVDSHCEILSLRETQILRSATDKVHTTRLPLVTGGHRISFVSYDVEAIWSNARSMCANYLTDIPWAGSLDHTQHVLEAHSSLHRPVSPPHLRVTPLVVSGHSSNRIDLVFFSDGCKLVFYFCTYRVGNIEPNFFQ
jgi:hypothetical protein